MVDFCRVFMEFFTNRPQPDAGVLGHGNLSERIVGALDLLWGLGLWISTRIEDRRNCGQGDVRDFGKGWTRKGVVSEQLGTPTNEDGGFLGGAAEKIPWVLLFYLEALVQKGFGFVERCWKRWEIIWSVQKGDWMDFATKICDQKSARSILNHQAHSQMQQIKTRFMIYTWVMMDLNVFEMHDIWSRGHVCFTFTHVRLQPSKRKGWLFFFPTNRFQISKMTNDILLWWYKPNVL